MHKFISFVVVLLMLQGCYSIGTTSTHNEEFSWGRSRSKPIYLSFNDTKTRPFYFLLSHDSKQKDYKLIIHWSNAKRGDVLFNGLSTQLKFLVDHSKIFTLQPTELPKVVSYNLNSHTHEEEAIFSISEEEMRAITYAKAVSVDLMGRNNTVIGVFNHRHTFKAFKEFMEQSY